MLLEERDVRVEITERRSKGPGLGFDYVGPVKWSWPGSNLVALWNGADRPPAVDWKEATTGDLLAQVRHSE